MVDGKVVGGVAVDGAPADSTSRSDVVAVLLPQAAAITATVAMARRRRTGRSLIGWRHLFVLGRPTAPTKPVPAEEPTTRSASPRWPG